MGPDNHPAFAPAVGVTRNHMTPVLFPHLKRWTALAAVTVALTGCAQSPEARSAKYIANGQKLLSKNDAPRAVLQFRNAVQATPRNTEAYYQLASAYLATGDLRNGINSLRKVLQLNPKHVQARLRLAQLMSADSEEGVLKDARQRLEDVLKDAPSNPDALSALALTEIKLGDQTGGILHLSEAAKRAPGKLTLTATLAEARLEQGDRKGAEDALRQAVAASPQSPDALVLLGRFLLLDKRTSEAEQVLQRALSLKSDHEGALFNLALLKVAAGQKAEAEKAYQRLSTFSDPTYNYLYASYLYQTGRRAEAVKEFERLYKKNPSEREGRSRLVAVYRAENRAQEGLQILNAALKKNPSDVQALLQRGELLFGLTQYTDALTDLNRLVSLEPESPEVHYALAKVYAASGASKLERAELVKTLDLDPTKLGVRLEVANSMIRDNAGQSALDILDRASNAQKNDPALLEVRNWALLSLNRLKEARQSVDQNLAVNRRPGLVLQDALLKLSARDYNGARTAAAEAFQKNPTEVRALQVIAKTYTDQGQLPVALQKVREYAAQAPKSVAAQLYLGQLMSRSGNIDEARRAFTAAKAADANLTEADLALAQLDVKAGNIAKARQSVTALLASHPNESSARLFLAQLDIQERNYAAAAEGYRKMLAGDPSNVYILNNLAYALAETGHHDEALKFAQQAKELSPERGDIDDTLGWVMYKTGVYSSAVEYLKTAVSRDNTALNNSHLAMAYSKSGDLKSAKQAAAAAEKLNPALPEAKQAQDILRDAANGSK